jgi:hypothetical protein
MRQPGAWCELLVPRPRLCGERDSSPARLGVTHRTSTTIRLSVAQRDGPGAQCFGAGLGRPVPGDGYPQALLLGPASRGSSPEGEGEGGAGQNGRDVGEGLSQS